jgi:hypothetical protein
MDNLIFGNTLHGFYDIVFRALDINRKTFGERGFVPLWCGVRYCGRQEYEN